MGTRSTLVTTIDGMAARSLGCEDARLAASAAACARARARPLHVPLVLSPRRSTTHVRRQSTFTQSHFDRPTDADGRTTMTWLFGERLRCWLKKPMR